MIERDMAGKQHAHTPEPPDGDDCDSSMKDSSTFGLLLITSYPEENKVLYLHCLACHADAILVSGKLFLEDAILAFLLVWKINCAQLLLLFYLTLPIGWVCSSSVS